MSLTVVGTSSYAGVAPVFDVPIPVGTLEGDLVVVSKSTQGASFSFPDARFQNMGAAAFGYPRFDSSWSRITGDLTTPLRFYDDGEITVVGVVVYRGASEHNGHIAGTNGGPQITAAMPLDELVTCSMLTADGGMPVAPDGYVLDLIAAPGGYYLNFAMSHWPGPGTAPAAPFTFASTPGRGWRTESYGYSGQGPVVRLYPRDDGRGLSAGPRLYPPPKASERLFGGYQ